MLSKFELLPDLYEKNIPLKGNSRNGNNHKKVDYYLVL